MEDRNIYLAPSQIAGYFKRNAITLETRSVLCAENGECSIYLSNEDGIMVFSVTGINGDEYTFEVYDDDDLDQYIRSLMKIGFMEEEIEMYDEEQFDVDESADIDYLRSQIAEREEELNTSVINMVYDVLGDDADEITEVDIERAAGTIKEIVCDVLAKKYGFPVYRPMMLIDEDTGEEFFEEYPYPAISNAS